MISVQKLKISGIMAAILLVLVFVRGYQLCGYPRGDRHVSISPDERAEAYLSYKIDKGFFGDTSYFYDIEVVKILDSGAVVKVHHEALEENAIAIEVDFDDLDRYIKWSGDSTIVFFSFGGLELRYDIPL